MPISLMLLLSDGTVMASNNVDTDSITGSNIWFRLTPDASGSYINGTWSELTPMRDHRLDFASQVLRDGRVFIAGGEYGNGRGTAEVYNPLTDSWTDATPPPTLWDLSNNAFSDSPSEMLPDGSVLIMPDYPHSSGVGLLYHTATGTWSNAGPLAHGTYQAEASWVKLADDSILTIDPYTTTSERYIAGSNTWINDGIVPTQLYDPVSHELGAGTLLPNGNAFFLGSTGHTAIYTPTGTLAPGVWTAGPNIPNNQGTPDAPAAMLPNGRLLCAVSPVPTAADHYPSPTHFYEYDWQTNAFTLVGGPSGDTDPTHCYAGAMLVLPDGNILYSHFLSDVYEYQPAGPPLASAKPVVLSVTPNADGTYHLTGTGLNGLSEGAWYGDENQMNSNYPIVRLSDGGPDVYYARTFNWSSTSVRTGSRVVSTEFSLPAGLPAAIYSLVVVANGVASDPHCLAPPVITVDPVSRAACGVSEAAFSVAAAGYGNQTYGWQLATAPGMPWQDVGRDPLPLPCGGFASVMPFDGDSVTVTIQGCAGSFQVRAIVSNDCGSATSSVAVLSINSADFNNDGSVGTDADIEAFFACLAGICCPLCGSADFNGDGSVGTDADIESFFRVLAGGPC
jgi:hypothetical protein